MKHILFVALFLATSQLFAQLSGNPQPNPSRGSASVLTPSPVRTPPAPPVRGGGTNLTPPTNPNDRVVFFTHGLGGSGGPGGSWSRVSDATESTGAPNYPARKITGHQPAYSQNSVAGAAQSYHNQLVLGDPLTQANGGDYVNNIVVAHSQGGVAARATDRLYGVENMASQRRFGGIVTFGTAHRGAKIINNEAQIPLMVEEGCVALTKPNLFDASIFKNALIDFIVPNQRLEDAANSICKFASHNIVPIALGDQQQPMRLDYAVGAPALENLNKYVSNTPSVAFYGIEASPELYRVMFNLLVKNPNDFDPFEADPDEDLVQKVSAMQTKYLSNYELHRARMEYLEAWGFPCSAWEWIINPLCPIWDTEYWQHKAKRDAWKAGYDWLLSSNMKYLAIIGAVQTTTTTGPNTCHCNGYTFPTTGTSCPPGCQFQQSGSVVINTTVLPNDGVVLASSAQGYPNVHATDKMQGSNHQQMRNDSNTKKCLNNVWDGIYHPFFFTETR